MTFWLLPTEGATKRIHEVENEGQEVGDLQGEEDASVHEEEQEGRGLLEEEGE